MRVYSATFSTNQAWMPIKMVKPFLSFIVVAEPCARLVSSYHYRRLQQPQIKLATTLTTSRSHNGTRHLHQQKMEEEERQHRLQRAAAAATNDVETSEAAIVR